MRCPGGRLTRPGGPGAVAAPLVFFLFERLQFRFPDVFAQSRPIMMHVYSLLCCLNPGTVRRRAAAHRLHTAQGCLRSSLPPRFVTVESPPSVWTTTLRTTTPPEPTSPCSAATARAGTRHVAALLPLYCHCLLLHFLHLLCTVFVFHYFGSCTIFPLCGKTCL